MLKLGSSLGAEEQELQSVGAECGSLLCSKARAGMDLCPGELHPLAVSPKAACAELRAVPGLSHQCFCFAARLQQQIQRSERAAPDAEGG